MATTQARATTHSRQVINRQAPPPSVPGKIDLSNTANSILGAAT